MQCVHGPGEGRVYTGDMLADSNMSPVYTLPLVLCALVMCYLQVRHPLRDWRKLGKCQNVIQHRSVGGWYYGVAVNSEGLLAVTDSAEKCIHLLRKEGAVVRSIGKGVLGGSLRGITFDLKGKVWVTDMGNNKVLKLSQDGRLLKTIDHAGSKSDHFNFPLGVSVSPDGLVYICDSGNHRVAVHDEYEISDALSVHMYSLRRTAFHQRAAMSTQLMNCSLRWLNWRTR